MACLVGLIVHARMKILNMLNRFGTLTHFESLKFGLKCRDIQFKGLAGWLGSCLMNYILCRLELQYSRN
jgi:hypothetical protein